MAKQSALGGRKLERAPGFVKTNVGRVIKNDRYEEFGIIEVVLLDHSSPLPIWVNGDIDRKPMTGDHVTIGYLDGRKDSPYLTGFVKNKNYSTHFITSDEKHIRLQIPVLEVGIKDGKAHNDTKKFLLVDEKKKERAYLELLEDGIRIYHPVDKDEVDNGAYIEIKKDYMKLYHPVGLDDDGAYIEMDASHTKIYNPIGIPGNGAFIDIGTSLTEIYHPTGNVLINVPNGILDVI